MLYVSSPNLEEVKKQLSGMKGKSEDILQKAINKAAQDAKKDLANLAEERYLISASDAKSSITVHKSSLSAEIRAKKSKPLSLYGSYEFKVSPQEVRHTNQPQSYQSQVLRAGGLKELIGSSDRSKAFVAAMKSGHVGIFERQTNAQRTAPRPGRQHDNPIAELKGPAISAMLGKQESVDKAGIKAEKALKERLDHEIKRALGATAK